MNQTNFVWKKYLEECYSSDLKSNPRGLGISEIIGAQYRVPMPAYITLVNRKVNYSFMFAEAAMLISGSNILDDVEKYMKVYARYSDDGIFMRGSYGPPFVDQAGYIVDTLENDIDSRQAVMTFWRQRPGTSKDIPCTVSAQFIIRNNKLHAIMGMRSHDIVKGFVFDTFTFSMMCLSIKLLLSDRGIKVDLGDLIVNASSLHIYETDYPKVRDWLDEIETTEYPIDEAVERVMLASTYKELKQLLWEEADNAKRTI